MSYSGVENTKDDLSILKGATITSIDIVPDGFGDEKIVMQVRWKKGHLVNDNPTGQFEIWMDAEGNGPGFIAFTGYAGQKEEAL